MTNVPLKFVASINDDKLDENTSPDRRLRYVDISAVSEGRIRAPIAEVTFAEAPSRARRLVRTGDVVLSTVRTYLRAVAPADESLNDCVWSTGFAVLRPRSVEPKYLCYAVLTSHFLDAVVARSVGVSYPAINPGDLGGIRVPVPPRSKQRMIANFLDAETGRIDALVRLRRRQRALLDERWTEVRRQLTRIDASASPGASTALRRISRLQAGAAFPHDLQGVETGTIPYVKVRDLSNVDENNCLRGAGNRVSASVAAALRSPILPVGTIVLPKIGAALLTNRRAIVSEPSCLDQNVMGVTVHTGSPAFVYHCLASIDLGDQSTPGPVPLLNEEAAKAVRIPWPPRRVQDAIVRELDARSHATRAPTAAIDRQLTLLRERRQALITAAVSGRIVDRTEESQRRA